MLLTPSQIKIAEDTHRFRVLVCGRKFGKTTLSAEEIAGAAALKNDQRVMYMAPTLGDARRLMWDRLKNKLDNLVIKENDTRLELRVRTMQGGESVIFLGSWELVNSYRGDEFDFIIFDEVQDYRNFWVGWQEAMRPTLTPRKGSALFMGTPKGFNHLYDLHNLHYDERYPDFASYRFTSYDNPHTDRDELDAARRELTEDRFAQEYLAEFKKSEGLVFKEFDRTKHIFTEPIYGYTERVAGVDFGYTNPTAIPHVVVKDGNYYVLQEFYKTQVTEDEVADYIAAQRFHKVYPDPENPSAIEVMRRKGVNVRQVKKGKDSIQSGTNAVRELFKQNRLFIHSSCVNLIAELETYSYPDKSPYRNANEKPLDENNHAIDALRYVVMSHTITKPFIQQPFNDQTIKIWRGF